FLIQQVGETPAEASSLFPHVFGSVLGIFDDVVGLNGSDSDRTFTSGPKVVTADPRKLFFDVFDIRAVDTDEHDQQAVLLLRAAAGGPPAAVRPVAAPPGPGTIVPAANFARANTAQPPCGSSAPEFN